MIEGNKRHLRLNCFDRFNIAEIFHKPLQFSYIVDFVEETNHVQVRVVEEYTNGRGAKLFNFASRRASVCARVPPPELLRKSRKEILIFLVSAVCCGAFCLESFQEVLANLLGKGQKVPLATGNHYTGKYPQKALEIAGIRVYQLLRLFNSLLLFFWQFELMVEPCLNVCA